MKTKTLLLLFVLSYALINAQSVDIKWSEKFIFDNKKDGFFDEFIGSNDQYIYAKFTNLALNPKKKDKKIKLLVFDKNTMKKIGEAPLKGYGGAIDEDDYDYYKTVTLNNVTYVFWTKEARNVVEVYLQSFDYKLKKINALKKVYELTRGSKSNDADKLLLIYNNALNGKILLGKEFGVNKDGENLRVEYKILNPDFSFVNVNQVSLPILVTKRRRGFFSSYNNSFTSLSCSYEFADDGNIYVEDMLKASEEEKKSLKKGEASVFPHIIQIQVENGVVRDYQLKFPKKNSFNYSSVITKTGIKLYGFFSDLDKDEKGNDTHGIFFVSLDPKTLTAIDTKFSYFEKAFLDQLFAADKENQKKGKGVFKSKKAKASDEQSIDDNYRIEDVAIEGDDIILFCTIMKNWSRTVCSTSSNGVQSCNTYYYCTKNNVTSFRLNKKGDILWAKNLDRSITYPGWNVYDLHVMKSDDNYYVSYGSAFQMGATKKNRKSKKSGKQMTDRFEYAIFSGKTGDYKKFEKQINAVNAKKADKKFINPTAIQVIDDKMYTESVRIKYKPTTWIACLCPPVLYGLVLSGNSRIGTGCFATISPLK